MSPNGKFIKPILFNSDFKKNGAIVDHQTKNVSFLRMVGILKQLGCENCYFLLALYQKELIGVDPYAKDLTKEQKRRIIIECKINPWYYFREISIKSSPVVFHCSCCFIRNIKIKWSSKI